MTKVAHIITGLSTGGAEMMLYKLLSRMDRVAFKNEVISLTHIGPVGERIRELGVPVGTLGMRRGVPNPVSVVRLAYWLRRTRPNVIQTWMYHADLIGGLASRGAGIIPVAWNIRHSYLDLQHSKRTTKWTAKLCARLSGSLPNRIVCCSEVSRRVHTQLGYEAKKMILIPNGFDLDVFKPDPVARRSVRQELGISEEAPLLGLIGRFNPQKDHHNFVRAAALLHARVPEVRFLLCGADITQENRRLSGWIEVAGIRDRCYLLGERDDIPRLNAALDVATSSSYSGEGFPNVVGEAMSCGVPCVVTDAGDSAIIVGETGVVVPPRDPGALAEGWYTLINMGSEGRRTLGLKARRRIEEHYSLDRITDMYSTLYEELAYKRPPK